MQLGWIFDVLWSKNCYIVDVEQDAFINIQDGAFFTSRGYPFYLQELEEVLLAVGVPGRGHGHEGAALQPHYQSFKGKEAFIIPEIRELLAGRPYLYGKKHRAQIDSTDHLVPELLL